ncbi:MAG: hypothetical protein V3V78_00975 [Candidatus Woesearchaeota archaeon]
MVSANISLYPKKGHEGSEYLGPETLGERVLSRAEAAGTLDADLLEFAQANGVPQDRCEQLEADLAYEG